MVKIQSMTGFGKAETRSAGYNVTIEIKSVNHRFRDFRFRMPQIFSSLELEFRKMIEEHFRRGSFYCYIGFSRLDKENLFSDIDEDKVRIFLQKMKNLCQKEGASLHVSPTDFLRSEFLREENSGRHEDLKIQIKETFQACLLDLQQARFAEGVKLCHSMDRHMKRYTEYYHLVASESGKYEAMVREKLAKKLQELEIDESRFAQELLYYLERLDIQEEQDRIASHLQKFSKILEGGGEIGRQIDFLLQELGRETNTIGSKSGLESISSAVVQMKVALENIREQISNIE